MTVDYRGIKARPHDVAEMCALNPALVELHCSEQDLDWMPTQKYAPRMSVHVPEYDMADGKLLDPASLDETRRKRAEEIYVHAVRCGIAWAPFFGAGEPPVIVFHPGGMCLELEKDEAVRGLMLAALAKTVKAMKSAGGKGVVLCIENMPALCWFFGGDWYSNIMVRGQELADFCERAKISACLDICHLYLACAAREMDWREEMKAMLPFVKHLHYSDATGVAGEGVQVGDGTLPLKDYFEAVKELNAVAVPEVWFAHREGGLGFKTAWARMARLMPGHAEMSAGGY